MRSAIARTDPGNAAGGDGPCGQGRGVVLLEVVLSLSLFFGAAVVVLVGLHSSVITARNLALEARAADLAVSVLSELQMGQLALEEAGPEEFGEERPYLADWTWQVVVEDVSEDRLSAENLPAMKRVDVVIANTRRGFTYRLVQWLPAESEEIAVPVEAVEPLEAAGGGR